MIASHKRDVGYLEEQEGGKPRGNILKKGVKEIEERGKEMGKKKRNRGDRLQSR